MILAKITKKIQCPHNDRHISLHFARPLARGRLGASGVSEVGGRRSEVGGRRSEVGGRRSEVGGKMVGLTLRGPPTCRHRRDRGQKKKCRLLIFEVREVGRPRRRAQSMWAKNRSNESWDIQAWTIQVGRARRPSPTGRIWRVGGFSAARKDCNDFIAIINQKTAVSSSLIVILLS